MYCKIFGTILDSSVWEEATATRLLWITMLVMADENGFVKSVEKGLARRARLSLEEVRAGLEVLEAPDLESKSQEYGGRRIERMEGGWQVLNYRKYREQRTKQQVLAAERQARHRDRTRVVSSTTDADVSACQDTPERDVSRVSRSVTTIATASASAGTAVLPRAREAVENSDGGDEAPAVDPIRAMLAEVRERGDDTRWCIECGGQRVTFKGVPQLRHRSWCPRRV